jgi:hypothetical protein
MIKIEFLQMIDQEFEDFENEKNKRKNIKMMLDFNSSKYSHNSKEFKMTKPKLKAKLKSSVFIKENNKGNSLF